MNGVFTLIPIKTTLTKQYVILADIFFMRNWMKTAYNLCPIHFNGKSTAADFFRRRFQIRITEMETPTLQHTGLEGSAAINLVLDITGHLQRSCHILMGHSCFGGTRGPTYINI